MEAARRQRWIGASKLLKHYEEHPDTAQVKSRIEHVFAIHEGNMKIGTTDITNRSTIITMASIAQHMQESRTGKFSELIAAAGNDIRSCIRSREALDRMINDYGIPVAFAAVCCPNAVCFDFNFPGCYSDKDMAGRPHRFDLSPLHMRPTDTIATSPRIPFTDDLFVDWIYGCLTGSGFGECCKNTYKEANALKPPIARKSALQQFERIPPATLLYARGLHETAKNKRKSTSSSTHTPTPSCEAEDDEGCEDQCGTKAPTPSPPVPTPAIQHTPTAATDHLLTGNTLWEQARVTPFQAVPVFTQADVADMLNASLPMPQAHHQLMQLPIITPQTQVQPHRDCIARVRAILCKQFIARAAENPEMTRQQPVEIIMTLQQFFDDLRAAEADPLQALINAFGPVEPIPEDPINAFATMATVLLRAAKQ
jgi:hypothetical protein